jgi:hypothetical protein
MNTHPDGNREPFIEPSVSSGFTDDTHNSIRLVPGHPELIERSLSLDIVGDPWRTVAMIRELPDYGINIPAIHPLVAQDQEPVDAIHGSPKYQGGYSFS